MTDIIRAVSATVRAIGPTCSMPGVGRKTLREVRSGPNYDELQIAAEIVEISDWGRFEGVVRLTVTNAIRQGSDGGLLDPGQSLLAVGMPILRRLVRSVRRCLRGRGCRRHPLFWGAGADHECIQSILAHDDRRTHPIRLAVHEAAGACMIMAAPFSAIIRALLAEEVGKCLLDGDAGTWRRLLHAVMRERRCGKDAGASAMPASETRRPLGRRACP